MEERTYPVMDEEYDGEYQSSDCGCMKAAEPMEAVAYNKASTYDVEDDIADACSIITPFIGPATYEEAIARIEEAERKIENGEVI